MTSKDVLAQLRISERQLDQTQVAERPGGTAGFNTFTDQGTYVPTYLGGTTAGVTTYSVQQGAWTRMGRQVTVTATIQWTAATGTGTAILSLPFPSANVANQNFGGSAWISTVTFANGTPLVLLGPNAATLSLFSPLTNAANTAVAVEAAGIIVFTVTYFVV
jgi:hypothetical protein